MPLGIQVIVDGASRTAVLPDGVVTFSVTAVNSSRGNFAELVLTGSNPKDSDRYGWLSRRMTAPAELLVRIVDAQTGDAPDHTDRKAEPIPSVERGIEAVKRRTKDKIAELQAELEELEKWDPTAK